MPDSDKYTINIRPEVWAEIENISEKHLNLVGPASAKKITDKLLDDIEKLAYHPYLGKECDELILIPNHYRRLISGMYLCIYRIIGNTIYIYHIVDGRTNYTRLLKNEMNHN
ncbi:type II toxin-antitoxin system RelE/ParE family toxin [Ruminococcus sp. HUN007]|uniref:type II toxin-antitoxin system RelE/ParE family toxin n=1 Tax=Ruminococcus sp. HUN007 TaxID=1514668 RepID=UPI0005D22DE9|nr:type II toxin-antitoxin system RelE/ParE family toxin [Ruminococcus sp. HUN007]MBR6924831.1 type II toxin-antitoxin system RelE/ParE family toxin [Oscillospiraceae bacterium]